MDNLVAMFLSAQRAFGARVHAVRDDQWQLPTPDTEWDVAALVTHLIEENRWVPPLIHGHNMEAAGKIVEGGRSLPADGGVGANLAQEWDEAAVAAADAFGEDGALERTVSLSRGPTPASDYIAEMVFDHIVHGWDLGKAIGYDGDPLPADAVEAAYGMAKGMGDGLAGSGMFEGPVEVPDDASTLDKLIALTGRNPR
jgi:uncharacterized protein (TIGR03086 family)